MYKTSISFNKNYVPEGGKITRIDQKFEVLEMQTLLGATIS